ncbi:MULTISPECIES: PAS domain-containing sensor histidine kinase [Amycolatopsis]|uniref:histidine kinase n=2 Tax=Amycolatopsis TaxID=1813 RepID=A0A1I3WPS0_9PSEU|nr:PAS domain S-box protein [Amycolatopsis sacchari]SFK09173.1 PAS domain S-box-containing protein [Amycolatopsis sacchari]
MPSAEQLLASILECVPQPVWVCDQSGRILYANPTAVRTVGYDDLAQLKGKSSHHTMHYKRVTGEPYPAEECSMLSPRFTGSPAHSDDDWLIRRDGTMFPVSWWSAPLALEDGRGVVVAFTDMTRHRAAERALREHEAERIRAEEARAAQRRTMETTVWIRRQTARDLHDGVQQRLVALLIHLHLLKEELPEHLSGLADDAVSEAEAAIEDVRAVAAGIHPAILSSRGLAAAVESLAARSPLPVSVRCSIPARPAEIVEANVYFLVSEALTNAIKHSAATEVTIDLAVQDGTLVVEVADDGVGGAAVGDTGTGLLGLADRVLALDGKFRLESPPGRGTVVHAEVPL